MTDEEDRSNLRDLHAGFALVGLLMSGQGGFNPASRAYELADMMQEARDLRPAGIVSVKSRIKKEKAHEN